MGNLLDNHVTGIKITMLQKINNLQLGFRLAFTNIKTTNQDMINNQPKILGKNIISAIVIVKIIERTRRIQRE